MTLQDQWWLMAGIVGLYLYDSALLLFHNEIVLEARRDGYLVSGGTAMEFRHRRLFLPNPLCPQRPLIRMAWRVDEPIDKVPQRLPGPRVRLSLSVIAPWTWLLLGLFFVGLPTTLWFGTEQLLLGWLVLTYLAIALMLGRVWRYRKALNLTNLAVAALAFDGLLCAPFAINMVRKISLRQPHPTSLRALAAGTLSPAENTALCRILRDRIQTSLAFHESDTAASDALRGYLKHFESRQS